MKTVIVDNKEYIVLKKYPHYTLCIDENGFRTCFDDFDLGLIAPRHRRTLKTENNNVDKGNYYKRNKIV